jgi:hypothetical protein
VSCELHKDHLCCEEEGPYKRYNRAYFVHLMISDPFNGVQFKDEHVVDFESKEDLQDDSTSNDCKHKYESDSEWREEVL